MKTLSVLLFLLAANGAFATSGSDALFPRPAALEPDIRFWLRVYTEIDTDGGFIHDSDNLTVVYQSLEFDAPPYSRGRTATIRETKARYRAILLKLASGARTGLSDEEKRVLALWPPGTTNERLRRAASSLRFQLGQADRFRSGLIRSGLWREHIIETLAARNLPLELAALPHVESSFNPNAYSRVGAAGLWQFTRRTGRRYLEIDHIVDQRLDPLAATEAAASLLADNYQSLDSWPLALIAYNHGASGMRRAVAAMGGTDIVPILREYQGPYFGFASRNFYPSFLAALEIDRNPSRYFGDLKPKGPDYYDRLEMPAYIPAAELADALGMTTDTLRRHNPALRETVWRGDKHIPRAFALRLPGNLAADLASVPAEAWRREQLPDRFHHVRRGDTLSTIAARYDTSVSTLLALNGLDSRHFIRAGARLRLPGAGPAPDGPPALVRVAPRNPFPAFDETGIVETSPSIADADLSVPRAPFAVAANNTIEVQPLETLGHYADWLGLPTRTLRRLNGLRYGQSVVLGQSLRLDFSATSKDEFLTRRLGYQRSVREAFFANYRVRETRRHVIQPGESLWSVCNQRYKVPLWLVRHYNPQLDPERLKPGAVVRIPTLVATNTASDA